MRTEAEQIAWEKQAYGRTKAEYLQSVNDWGMEYDMAAMSQCSDVQDILQMISDDSSEIHIKRFCEMGRQALNRAKMLIMEQCEKTTHRRFDS